MLADELDLALSYTETAATDAQFITELLRERLAVYNYKHWLDAQEGRRISSLAERIYEDIPCIVLVTRDWFVRPATVLEGKHLGRNGMPKLIFDYAGEFRARGLEHHISACEFGVFEDDGGISPISITAFVGRTYSSLRY